MMEIKQLEMDVMLIAKLKLTGSVLELMGHKHHASDVETGLPRSAKERSAMTAII